jgi:hypothetical protein
MIHVSVDDKAKLARKHAHAVHVDTYLGAHAYSKFSNGVYVRTLWTRTT